MHISSTSTSSGSAETQRILAALLSHQQGTGQDVPGAGESSEAGETPVATASAPAPSNSQLSQAVLSWLMGVQAQPPSTSNIAAKLISAVDTNGDGTVSLDEVKKALSGNSPNASGQTNSLSDAFGKLDSNGDGQLSSNELTTALEAFRTAVQGGTAQASGTLSNVSA